MRTNLNDFKKKYSSKNCQSKKKQPLIFEFFILKYSSIFPSFLYAWNLYSKESRGYNSSLTVIFLSLLPFLYESVNVVMQVRCFVTW